MKNRLAVAFLMMCSVVTAATDVYNWPAEWVGTGVQPDGVWSYKGCSWDNNTPATFSLLSWSTADGYGHWYYGDDSWWYRIADGWTDNYANAYTIITWTAPKAGYASVEVSATVGGWGNCNAIFQIMDKQGNLLVNETHSNGAFSHGVSNLPVNAGDSIYIRTRTTVDGQYKSVTFNPIKVTLSSVEQTVTLENFEANALSWLRAEPNDHFSIATQSAVVYEGQKALDFHIDAALGDPVWCRIQGLPAAPQDWSKYDLVLVKVKSTVPYLDWDFLAGGTDDTYRVNGTSGCGYIPLAGSNSDWQTIVLDLRSWPRTNVTGLELYLYSADLPDGANDVYIDDIQLVSFTAPASLPGDANNDGKVDVSDLGILAANYGKTANATWAMGDFNNDGKVDVSDLGILAAHYGTGTGASADFNRDAKALGLVVDDNTSMAKADSPVSGLGCGSAGLPLVAGLALMGLMLIKLEE